MLADEPIFPGKRVRLVKLVDELEQKIVILAFQVFDSKATEFFPGAGMSLGDETLRAIAFVLSRQEK